MIPSDTKKPKDNRYKTAESLFAMIGREYANLV